MISGHRFVYNYKFYMSEEASRSTFVNFRFRGQTDKKHPRLVRTTSKGGRGVLKSFFTKFKTLITALFFLYSFFIVVNSKINTFGQIDHKVSRCGFHNKRAYIEVMWWSKR